MKKYLLAVPCYNCEKQIVRVINEVEKLNYIKELKVIFVDNRSEDFTLENIKKKINTNSNFSVVQNNENYGLGGSHKIIFSYAIEQSYDYVIILHGDNQARTNEIDLLININNKINIDAILGSRFMRKSKLIGYSKIRTYGNFFLNTIYTIFFKKIVKDLGSGLNLYNVDTLKKIDFLKFDDGFTFNMDMLIFMIRNKLNFKYIPITWVETDQVSNAKAVDVGFKTLKKIFINKYKGLNKNYFFKKIK